MQDGVHLFTLLGMADEQIALSHVIPGFHDCFC